MFQPEGLDEVLDVSGIARDAMAPGHFLRVALPAHVGGDDAAGLREGGGVLLKEVMATAQTRDQDQGWTNA